MPAGRGPRLGLKSQEAVEGCSKARQPRGLWAAEVREGPPSRGLCDEGGTVVRLRMKPNVPA